MSKFVIASMCNENMSINIDAYDTYKDAYSKMEKEYNEIVEGSEDMLQDNNIYEDSAYVISDYEYVWQIKEV